MLEAEILVLRQQINMLRKPPVEAAFRRIRHYGLFATGGRAHNITRARELLNAPARDRPAMQMPPTPMRAPNRRH